jgi:hypothetical protein
MSDLLYVRCFGSKMLLVLLISFIQVDVVQLMTVSLPILGYVEKMVKTYLPRGDTMEVKK